MTYEQPDKPYELLIEQDRKDDESAAIATFEATKIKGRLSGAKQVEEEETANRRIVCEPLSSYKKRRAEWLLHRRIPASDLTLIIGKGNVGKSTLLTLLCAYVTSGTSIEGERYAGGRRPVMYCHSEDSVEVTILPRMEAAGVDTSLVHLIRVETPDGAGALQIPRDMDRLMETAKSIDAAAIFYDPISSFLQAKGGGSRNDADSMRQAYLAIQAAHDANGIAGIGLGHTRKALSDSLLDAFMGSSEQTNVIRSAIGVIPDPDVPGRYIISQEKHNKAPWSKSYTYRIESVPGILDEYGQELEDISRIVITGTTKETCTDVLRGQSMLARREAKRFILDYLEKQGPTASQEVAKAAAEKGHSNATTYRAGEDLAEYGKIKITQLSGMAGRRHEWELSINPLDYLDPMR